MDTKKNKIINTELVFILLLMVAVLILLVMKVLIPSLNKTDTANTSTTDPDTVTVSEENDEGTTVELYDPSSSSNITKLIEDKDAVALQLDTARTEINGGNPAAAAPILDSIDPNTLTEDQAEFYYQVLYLYSSANGDNETAANAKVEAANRGKSDS